MIQSIPILTILTFLPIFTAVFLFVFAQFISRSISAIISLISSFATLGVVVWIWTLFDWNAKGFQFSEKYQWFKEYDIYYQMSIDGLSLSLITLTAILIPICIFTSLNSIKKQKAYFVSLFILLEGLIIGVFCASDLILFYVFFEAVLIPMFFIIGIWGGADRVYASFKFFLYTILGSLSMLLGILCIYSLVGTTYIYDLYSLMPIQSVAIQKILWIAFFLSFAVKTPMWPFHTWLPDAHVQAPTGGSVILAGVLLKLGGYGFLRLSLPLFPIASLVYRDFVFSLSAIAVIYASLVALMQTDIKKMIAYSSIAHMGFVTAGIFSGNPQGLQGAIIQMISHGLISAALFLLIGVLYDRMHTKEISFYNGLANKMPRYSVVFILVSMGAIGLPGTAGFIGEFSVLLSVFQQNRVYSAFLALGMVLGASYMLWLIARVLFGEMKNEKLINIKDITFIEKSALYSLVLFIIAIGLYPSIITSVVDKPVKKILSVIDPNNTYMIHNLE